jgi:hypothetical protein
MIIVAEFEPEFVRAFPELAEVFKRAPLTVHEGVARVTLHGLHGQAGEFNNNSEIDLRLLVDSEQYPDVRNEGELLKEMIFTTLADWREKTKLDLTVIFDTRNCDLKCFNERSYNSTLCVGGGLDCFGMYKIEYGEGGFILNSNMNVKYIYPCITVWKNPRAHR